MRYAYFHSKSRERVEQFLEDCFAAGEISPGEGPRIERRGAYWILTLEH